MAKKEIGYSEAVAEVEAILERFNGGEFDVDKLSIEVKRATELLAMCKDRLYRAENEIAQILEKKPNNDETGN